MSDQPREGAHRGPSEKELRAAAPQDGRRRELRVGIFVLIGILGVVTVLFLLTDPATLRGRYLLVTRVEDAGGIRRGDPVLMRGVNVGRVHSFSMTREGRVDITLEIEGEWDIPDDSRTQFAGAGLFGGRTIQIIRGTAATVLEPTDTIPGIGQTGGVIESAEALGVTAEQVLTQVRKVLDDPMVETLRTSAVELRLLLDQFRSIATVQRDQLGALTASLGRSAVGIEEAGPDIARVLSRSDSTLMALNRASVTLDRALSSLEVVLGRMEAGEGTLGRLSRDDSLYVSLNRAASALGDLAEDIRADPRKYVNLEIF